VTVIYYDRCNGDFKRAEEEIKDWKLYNELKATWDKFDGEVDKKAVVKELLKMAQEDAKVEEKFELMNDDGEWLIEIVGAKDAGKTWNQTVAKKLEEVGKKYEEEVNGAKE